MILLFARLLKICCLLKSLKERGLALANEVNSAVSSSKAIAKPQKLQMASGNPYSTTAKQPIHRLVAASTAMPRVRRYLAAFMQ